MRWHSVFGRDVLPQSATAAGGVLHVMQFASPGAV